MSLDTIEAELPASVALGFGVDLSNFAHEVESSKINGTPWTTAQKCKQTPKTKIDAVARTHGAPTSLLGVRLERIAQDLRGEVRAAHSMNQFLGQSCFEALRGDTDRRAIAKKSLKTEQSRHLRLKLHSTLSIQTKRRFVTSMPTTYEKLRTKGKLMSIFVLLGEMRQPGRP